MTPKTPESRVNPRSGQQVSGYSDLEVEDLLREFAPQVLGILVRRYRDFDSAEDAVQEALLAAALQWPDEGVPENPRAWLVQVAQRRLVDAVRAEVARRQRESATALREAPTTIEDDGPGTAAEDDSLTLFFLCCHPTLPPAGSIALTLRAVGGLTTAEIAHAFLVPEATMAQRISRAKKKLGGVDRPFAMPAEDGSAPTAAEWRDRLGAVLRVLYLMFTEGHTTTAGPQLRRGDLATEAIRLTRAVHRQLPGDHEVTGLLALMLLTDARRAARSGPSGELIPLAEQDRTRWDRDMITEGMRLATRAVGGGLRRPYQIQAAIAALHAQARRAEDTDWDRILLLYTMLESVAPNPMVTLNRAVATAMVHGPAAGLAVVAVLDDALTDTHRLAAVRGHFHEMAGDPAAAIACYATAVRRTTSLPERDYLTLRAARLRREMDSRSGGTGGGGLSHDAATGSP
ncbi:RNA polymerase sigma factor [Nocardia sp. CC227C]|uniref:RNA polymerase sigma factor n=1 Tax=Nocardia sp. CC227C TaxID=3044562 RepID=UPI00278C2B01|nr:sigma-70 family RNA polymerase sigma factor [Nocardia sp. CC227C]